MADFQDISEFINVSRGALDLLKGAVGLLPKDANRDAIEAQIQEAERALAKSDAKLAKELGMRLCDCTFPPQIMLWREAEKAHVCPNEGCGRRAYPRTGSKIRTTRLIRS